MGQSNHQYGAVEQAGLEVAPQHRYEAASQLPEVAPQDRYEAVGQFPEVRPLEQEKYAAYAPYHKAYADDPEVREVIPQPVQQRGRRRWLMIGGVIVAVLVIVGAVLGGVLGSRAAKSLQQETPGNTAADGTGGGPGAGPTTSASITSASLTPTAESMIRQGSPLTVTSWRGSKGPELFLYFQDRKGKLRQTRYYASQSSPEWSEPTEMNSSADNNTRLAGTVLLYRTAQQPQIELFYSTSTRVLGLSINDATTPEIQPDSVNDERLLPAANSSVAAYWPWLIYQEADGAIVQVRNLLTGGRYSPQSKWDVDKLGVYPVLGSRLALVPLSTNITKSSWKGGYAIFYQGADNSIYINVPEVDSDEIPQPYARSLPSSFPTVKIPRGAPIAAFAVARPGDAQQQRVNTYILYLDESSNIHVLYTEDSEIWQQTQPDALKKADADTDIACATMPQTFADGNGNQLLLEEASDMTRCYFQRGGEVVGVKFDGKEWTEVENVKIPLM